MVDEAVCDAGFRRDVGDAGAVKPLAREHGNRGIEDGAALVGCRRLGHQRAPAGVAGSLTAPSAPSSRPRYASGRRCWRLGRLLRISFWMVKSRSAETKHSLSAAWAMTTPQASTIIERP